MRHTALGRTHGSRCAALIGAHLHFVSSWIVNCRKRHLLGSLLKVRDLGLVIVLRFRRQRAFWPYGTLAIAKIVYNANRNCFIGVLLAYTYKPRALVLAIARAGLFSVEDRTRGKGIYNAKARKQASTQYLIDWIALDLFIQ